MKRLKPPSPEIILIVGIICILITPWLFTRSLGIIPFNNSTGVIGDTIGGITAPITGLIGSYLVYMALKAQIEANRLIIDQFDHQKKDDRLTKRLQYITDQIQILREDIREFRFVTIGNAYQAINHYSNEAIGATLNQFSKIKEHNFDIENDEIQELKQIQYFLQSINYLIQLSEELEEEDQYNLKRVIKEIYRTKLYPSLTKYEKNRLAYQPECTECKLRHPGLPEYIYIVYDIINKKIPVK